MPTFIYEAMNSVGQQVKSQIEATSSEDAIAKIRAQGEFPTKVKEKAAKKGVTPAAGRATTAGRRRAGRIPTKMLTQFTRQLSTLIDAGLPIVRSLRILEQQQKPGPMRLAIRLVAEDVEEGITLSEAMGAQSKAFNRLYCNMIRAGELGGVLDLVLRRLAEFLERTQALKRRVVGAMLYPVAVITFSVGIVMAIMIIVIPKFETIFLEMGQALPPTTEALIAISRWVQFPGFIVILAMPVVIYLVLKLLKMSPQGRYGVDAFFMNIPLFGQIIRKTAVARFSRTMGTLLGAGVPILEALNITRETAGNEVFSKAMITVHDGIREGESFAAPLRQAKIVEPMVVNMIDVGEETGKQDQMLDKIADVYDEEVQTLVDSMVSLLEPVMVIVLGLIVGFIVISLFMPMVSVLSSLSGG